MSSNNPIYVGFQWSQAFDFGDGFFMPGDTIRAEFRRDPRDGTLLASVSDGVGARVEGSILYLSLEGLQTRTMRNLVDDYVVTSPVLQRNGEEIALGCIFSIPVDLLPTRPLA